MPEDDELPMEGLDHKKIPALTRAVKEYHTHKTARVDALVKEKAAKAKVLELMHQHADDLNKGPEGELYYRTGDLVSKLIPGKDKLKVQDADESDAEEEE